MSHNIADSDVHNAITSLTIANHAPANSRGTRFEDSARTEARITKLGGFYDRGLRGIRVKARRLTPNGRVDTQVSVEIEGEDLYALREFLAELPEEAFVRPADPVVKPPRWAEHDVVQETTDQGTYTWVRGPRFWSARIGGGITNCSDAAVSQLLAGVFPLSTAAILRQASGQDL